MLLNYINDDMLWSCQEALKQDLSEEFAPRKVDQSNQDILEEPNGVIM